METKIFLKYKQQCPVTDSPIYVDVETNKQYILTEWKNDLNAAIDKDIVDMLRKLGERKRFDLLDEIEDEADKFYINLLKTANGKITARNESGVLWESLWEYDGQIIKKKTVCSGLFNDWHTFESMAHAYESIKNDLHAIKKLRL